LHYDLNITRSDVIRTVVHSRLFVSPFLKQNIKIQTQSVTVEQM